MRVFISSTFRDLRRERAGVEEVLRRMELEPWGMELFVSEPTTPLDVALRELSLCDAVVLITGFKAGSLVADREGVTYTAAEFERARELGKPVFGFIKTEGQSWVNKEPAEPLKTVLEDFKVAVEASGITVKRFEAVEELKVEVLIAFQRWNDQGRPGARRTFTTSGEFFAPWVSKPGVPKLFDFEQTLYGRDAERGLLQNFLENPARRVCLLSARGGVGKSKFLRDWSSGVQGYQVLFVRDGADWHFESFKEIPSGNVLVISDDAHRQEHLDKLLAMAKELQQRRHVKVLLSLRPSGAAQIDSQVARRFDAGEVQRIQLERLSTRDVRALAAEVLGQSHHQYAPELAALSADTPLVTVVGGRLIARGDIPPALLVNEDAFRRAVFDKLSEEYDRLLPAGPVPWRPLLNIIAAVSPLQARSDAFLAHAEELLGNRRDEILIAIDALERHGLLLRGGTLVRIVPDVLSDYILEGACLNEKGEATGYAETIFRHFGQAFLGKLLRNLAELDWRIAHKHPATGLLDSVWKKLMNDFEQGTADQRISLLKSIQNAAIFQPDQSMSIARFAIENEAQALAAGDWELDQGDVLRELIPVLKMLSYHSNYTDEAVRRLWYLAKRKAPNPLGFASEAGRIVLQLAEYDRYKSPLFNDRIADLAVTLAQQSDAFDGDITPLDIADKLLAKEGSYTESEGYSIAFGGFVLNYPAIKGTRMKALELIDSALNSHKPELVRCALKSLSAVLSPFLPKFGRALSREEQVWHDEERLQALEMIHRRVRLSPLPTPLARNIDKLLRQLFPKHGSEVTAAKYKEVREAIPHSDALTIFDAFCTARWERDSEHESLEEADQNHAKLVQAGIDLFRKAFPTVEEQIVALERMTHDAVDYGIDLGESAPCFVGMLCEDSEFLFGFASYLPDSEDTVLGHLISVPVRRLRDSDAAEYRRIGLAAAAHSSVYIAHGTANAICYGPALDSPTPRDIEILAELSKHPHSSVRQVALNGIGVLGKTKTYHDIAVRLLCEIEIGAESKLADAMCKALGHGHINRDALSEDEVKALLAKIVPVGSLDQYYIGRFLEWASRQYPEAVFEFVQQRLEYSRCLNEKNESGSSYRPVPFQDVGTRFQGLRQSEKYAHYLQEICNLLRDVFDSERSWLLELFWVIGAEDVTTLSVLDDLLHSGDPTRLDTLQELISQASPEFALSCPFFAVHVLETCAERSQQLLNDLLSTLVTNAHLGMSARAAGQASPKFLSVRDRASQLAGRFPSGSAARLLFTRIRESAENAIQDERNQDGELEF